MEGAILAYSRPAVCQLNFVYLENASYRNVGLRYLTSKYRTHSVTEIGVHYLEVSDIRRVFGIHIVCSQKTVSHLDDRPLCRGVR